MAKDLVCGMYVDEERTPFKVIRRETTYYFCSKHCLESFLKPEKTLKKLKFLTIIAFALGILIVILEHFYKVDYIWLFLLATPVQFGCGYIFYIGLKDSIKAKQFNMDSLIAIGTSAAYFYSTILTFQNLNILPKILVDSGTYYIESSLIIAFILLGRLMELTMKEKASESIRKLLDLQPKMARVVKNNGEIEIPAEKVNVNDLVIVKPGEKIPVDGVVVDGYSYVDQSILTGESIPIEKKVGDEVFSGTINKNGILKIKATNVGKNTTLFQIYEMVEKSILSRVPIQRLADKISSYFVPIVILIALFSFSFWYFVAKLPLNLSLTILISVLIIACPCALGIASPLAIMLSAVKGAQRGILIRGGEYLEKACKINLIAFDKTGTLTKGELSLLDIITFDNIDKDFALKLAGIAEKGSEHLIGRCIVNAVKEKNIDLPDPEFFENLPGLGVKARYKENEILIGNRKLMELNEINLSNIEDLIKNLEEEGKTLIFLSLNGKLSAIFAVADIPREEALETIKNIKEMGIEVVMISGDNKRTANAIAKRLGIEKVFAEVLPNEKANVIKELKKDGKVVAMVGDGINDAPALVASDVGIAIGSGTDIAKEAGGIVLIKNDLRDIVNAIKLSRLTVKKIKQNLFWAFFYNIVLIPVAAGILYPFFGIILNPIYSAIAMASSSITVVSNSLTLTKLYQF